MLNRVIISKSGSFLPRVMPQRSRIRKLVKENFDEYETPYMKVKRPGRSLITDFAAFVHRKNWKFADVLHWLKWKSIVDMRLDQKFMPERNKILGPDLAAAHFITYRYGKVKFKDKDKWMTKDNIDSGEIPSFFTEGFFIEELDASDSVLCFEGFENLCHLHGLKKLILRNCQYIDDYCLQRLYFMQNTLEYLDISGCENVTERGICTLHILRHLKMLVMNDTPNVQNKELVCLLLQEILPKCEVRGIDYNDPTLVQRIQTYIK